jgi:hypothetical protein
LKLTLVALVLLLIPAAFCAAQSESKAETSNATQSAQQPASGASTASEQTPSASQPAAGQPAGESPSKSKGGAASGTSNDRLFFALPNFLTVDENGKIIPLTAGQKFKVVARGAFDPAQIVWYAALSGIGQAENSEPGYGQGAVGYVKRYATYAADGTIENFLVGAIFPSLLHQDPRFFPTTSGSFLSRAGYAASRIVVTRTDSGNRQFNYSEVFGSAMASAISTYSYHPKRTFRGVSANGTPEYWPSDRTLKNTASVWVSQMGYDAITFVLKEFWPDLRRKVKKQPH